MPHQQNNLQAVEEDNWVPLGPAEREARHPEAMLLHRLIPFLVMYQGYGLDNIMISARRRWESQYLQVKNGFPAEHNFDRMMKDWSKKYFLIMALHIAHEEIHYPVKRSCLNELFSEVYNNKGFLRPRRLRCHFCNGTLNDHTSKCGCL